MTDRDDLRKRLDAVEEDLGGAGELSIAHIWGEEEPDGDPDLVVRSTIVMFREDAEREGREILGPADTASGRDTVRVRPERDPWESPDG